jgi:hypothetical protein
VCGMKVDVDAIHRQEGLHLSVGAPVGQLGKLRPIVNRPTAAIAADSGGRRGTLWVARWLPACPTSRQRFHFNANDRNF